jgi:dTDP-4-amino-4,6-dideoxygalactose transaminase
VINVFQPALGADEISAIRQVFESNWLGPGEQTTAFEEAFAQHLAVPSHEIISTNSCTEGLFQVLNAIDLRYQEEVILPTISFVGAANAIAAAGGRPVFCDVDPRSLNPTPQNIEQMFTPKTRGIVLLHYGGWPPDLAEIVDFCRVHSLFLIEDAAISVASRLRGKACGTFGDFGVWSFDAMKVLVTGDGGMIWSRNPVYLNKIRHNIGLGLTSVSGFKSSSDTRWWEFDIKAFGRKALLNDVASALGLVQLRRLPSFIERKREIFNFYLDALTGIEWIDLPPEPSPEVESSYYFFWLQCKLPVRDRLANYLRDNGVYTTFRYHPLHLISLYGDLKSLPASESAAAQTLLLPLHQSLSQAEMDKVVDLVHRFPI